MKFKISSSNGIVKPARCLYLEHAKVRKRHLCKASISRNRRQKQPRTQPCENKTTYLNLQHFHQSDQTIHLIPQTIIIPHLVNLLYLTHLSLSRQHYVSSSQHIRQQDHKVHHLPYCALTHILLSTFSKWLITRPAGFYCVTMP